MAEEELEVQRCPQTTFSTPHTSSGNSDPNSLPPPTVGQFWLSGCQIKSVWKKWPSLTQWLNEIISSLHISYGSFDSFSFFGKCSFGCLTLSFLATIAQSDPGQRMQNWPKFIFLGLSLKSSLVVKFWEKQYSEWKLFPFPFFPSLCLGQTRKLWLI